MRTATVGEIQKNFSKILKEIHAGEEIDITRHGKPVARLIGLGPKENIDWPEFWEEAVSLKGKPIGDIVIDGREDRF